MYEKIEVWHPSEDRSFVYVFVCFRGIVENVYYVQSIDAFRPEDKSETIAGFRNQAVELFLDTDIADRTKGYPSLTEAIEAAMSEWGIRP